MTKIVLNLESPLMVGGKRIKDNVLKSLDYIPGHVMRAAFAKQILLQCPLYQPNQPNEEGRFHYVYVRDEEKCKDCPMYEACKNFSTIKFSYFYPEGCEIFPLTTQKCKYDDNHGFVDTLIPPEKFLCKRCLETYSEDAINSGQVGRLDTAKGYRKGSKTAKVLKSAFIHTAIDSYTQTAIDGSLYTVYSIKQGIRFEGTIEKFELLNLDVGDVIRVGSYVSTGLGKLRIESIETVKKGASLFERLKEFNERILKTKETEGKVYIPLLLKSDAKLGLEEIDFSNIKSDDEYKEKWRELLFNGSNGSESFKDFKVEKVFSEQEIYRGYDTSKKKGEWSKNPEIHVLKGTSILLSSQNSYENIIRFMEDLEEQGVGKERENGFGEIEIANVLHLKGEI